MIITEVLPQDLFTTSDPVFNSVNGVYIKTVATGNYSLGDSTTMGAITPTSGTYNLCFGSNAGSAISTGDYNVCFGLNSGISVSTTNFNTFIGGIGTGSNVTSESNLGIGSYALNRFLGGNGANVAIGDSALRGIGASTRTGYYNVAIGKSSGYAMDTGFENTLIGYQTGVGLTSGNNNAIIGSYAGQGLTSGIANMLVGSFSGNALTTQGNNVLIGGAAGIDIKSSNNTGIGSNVLTTVVGGDGRNVAIGWSALYGSGAATKTHAYNTGLGYQTGYLIDDGTYNIFLGPFAGYNQASSTGLFIVDAGDQDGTQRADTATEATNAILYGVMAATPASQTLAINADTTISRDLRFTTSLDSAAVADEVSLGCYELSAGNRALAISQESAVAADTDETKFSHKLPVRINGATYYIMLTAT